MAHSNDDRNAGGPNRVVVSVKPATFDSTGVGFLVYGDRYVQAARVLGDVPLQGFDPVSFHLNCQAVELYLKAFIWLRDRKTRAQIRSKYGHQLEKLWSHSKARGISKFASVTPLRDEIIGLVGPYYTKRRFAYFDLEMVVGGYADLRSQPRAIPTLQRLSRQLGKSLRHPVLSSA